MRVSHLQAMGLSYRSPTTQTYISFPLYNMQTICILVLVSERNTWQIGKHESRLGRVKATGGGEGHNYSPERLKPRNNASKQHRRRMATPLLKGLIWSASPFALILSMKTA